MENCLEDVRGPEQNAPEHFQAPRRGTENIWVYFFPTQELKTWPLFKNIISNRKLFTREKTQMTGVLVLFWIYDFKTKIDASAKITMSGMSEYRGEYR